MPYNGGMRPAPGEVLHFSEDPGIDVFVPQDVYVWAVDAARSPDYWFPRQCPRAMAWLGPSTSVSDRERIIGPDCGERVHAIEYGWLDAMRQVRLYAYRLPAEGFVPVDTPTPHAVVSTATVRPLAPPQPVGDLLRLHEEAGIQLRVLPNLWSFWDNVIASTLEFSGIRLRNAKPRA